jgi:hypothetical protein
MAWNHIGQEPTETILMGRVISSIFGVLQMGEQHALLGEEMETEVGQADVFEVVCADDGSMRAHTID